MFLDLEIRVLVCKKDIEMCLNMVNSLRRYEEFKYIPIFFHDDGSLDIKSKDVLIELGNSYIIEKEYADAKITQYINGYANCEKYRLANNRLSLWYKIKLFDFYFLSKSKNILCIDTDILFILKPDVMIELIKTSNPFYFPDFQNSYSFRKNTNINVLDKVNTGLFYIPSSEYYDINSIETALTDLYNNGIFNTPQWIEQSAYAHMFYQNGKYSMLDESKYKIPTEYELISKNIECLHFVGHPPIREMYDGFLKIEYL
jgi:hypothetical protein